MHKCTHSTHFPTEEAKCSIPKLIRLYITHTEVLASPDEHMLLSTILTPNTPITSASKTILPKARHCKLLP